MTLAALPLPDHVRLCVTINPNVKELVKGQARSVTGTCFSSTDAKRAVTERYPNKAFCLVEQWTVFQAAVTESDLIKIRLAGHLPLFVFAHKVIEDSRRRFQEGDWVRSSMCISFQDGLMFETKNTIYVLMGDGHEMKASLKTIFSFF